MLETISIILTFVSVPHYVIKFFSYIKSKPAVAPADVFEMTLRDGYKRNRFKPPYY